MRTLLLASLGAALAVPALAPAAADAQRMVRHGPGAGYPMPGRTVGPVRPMTPPMAHPGPRPVVYPQGGRWGSKVGGRWWGGANAPGGWTAYRRPYRGYALPTYWIAPRFFINDWQGYGLSQPGSGYNWVRYYDDAVLIDGRGSVYDMRGGIDWDDTGYDDRDDDYAEDRVYAGPEDRGYPRRDDSGLGGAAIGAVAGGVAGNLVAGRGNRLGGTLIGAGAGAGLGYAVDKAEDRDDRDRRMPPPPMAPRGAPYPPPPGGAMDGRGYPSPPPAPRGHWVSPDGGTTVTTTSSGSYASGGYGYPGGTTTTVIVQSAPAVTTTTTEIYEDSVTYSRMPMRKTYRKLRARPRCACR